MIVGNGPSAISLSYMLSGWTPYYAPQGIPDDDLLHLRLSYQAKDNVPITEMVSPSQRLTRNRVVFPWSTDLLMSGNRFIVTYILPVVNKA